MHHVLLSRSMGYEGPLRSRERYALYRIPTASVAETKDLDENAILDLDAQGQTCGLTIEHASARADIPHFSYEQVAA